MFRLISTIVGAAVIGGLGYLGYKRYFGSTDTITCSVETPWYLPAPKYSCGQKTPDGEIDGMQYMGGEWAYHFSSGKTVREAAIQSTSLTGAPVQILR